MKIQTLAILACAASLYAQESTFAAQATAAAPAATSQVPCESSFEAIKNTYPRDAAADRIYAMVNARIIALKNVAKDKRSGDIYAAELKSCDLAVDVLKTQLSNAALRKNLDSLLISNLSMQKEISAVKDSLIKMWASDAQGAKDLNARLSDERNKLERESKENAEKDSLEKARLMAEIAKKDSLIAAQKAEAEKKLEALRSKTISVYKDARGTILSMSDILFETGKASLTQELKLNLAEVSTILKSLLTESKVLIEGHTDDVGSDQLNQTLSENRAKGVLDFLVERGVEKQRLSSVGYGKTKPIVKNDTPENKAKNRRVELVINDM